MTMLVLDLQLLYDKRRETIELSGDEKQMYDGCILKTDDILTSPHRVFARIPVGLYCDTYEGGDGVALFVRNGSGKTAKFSCVTIRASGVTAFESPPPYPPVIGLSNPFTPSSPNGAPPQKPSSKEELEQLHKVREAWKKRGRIMLYDMVLSDIHAILSQTTNSTIKVTTEEKAALKTVFEFVRHVTIHNAVPLGSNDINIAFHDFRALMTRSGVSGHATLLFKEKATPPLKPLVTFINKHVTPLLCVGEYTFVPATLHACTSGNPEATKLAYDIDT